MSNLVTILKQHEDYYFKDTLLMRIDKLDSFTAKLEYLNAQFLDATTTTQEELILDMIKQLKMWGQ